MGAGTGQHLHVEGNSLLHRMPATAKLVGLLALVVVVVAIPKGAWFALAGSLCLGMLVLVSTGVSARHTLPRLAVDLPFVVFALVLPFVATGTRVPLGPVTVSESGLVAAGTLLAKASTGALVGVAFAVTTAPRDLVLALQQLRVPDPMVSIVSFMVRYLSVVSGELARMRIALASRGFRGRSLRSWPTIAASAGALFVRSFERGERVHLAMLSRGYAGRLPALEAPTTTPSMWALALAPAAIAGGLLVGALR